MLMDRQTDKKINIYSKVKQLGYSFAFDAPTVWNDAIASFLSQSIVFCTVNKNVLSYLGQLGVFYLGPTCFTLPGPACCVQLVASYLSQ